MRALLVSLALPAALVLAACGNTTGDRAASGAGIGAATGAVVGAVTGLTVVEGALIGAAAGGLTGAVTDESQINLGKPLWRDGSSSTASANTTVREIQSGLTQLGYNPGPVDGVYGGRTRSAIQSYQYDNGIAVDGQATAALARHIQDRLAGRG